MSQTKYIMSGGLAYTENKDMEKLRKYSSKGWHVREFKFMGYLLEKGESKDYIYNVDYRLLDDDGKEEYFNMFLESGWTHVASEGDIHLFRAKPGTRPIYTDRDTTIQKYENSNSLLNKLGIPFLLITILVWVASALSPEAWHNTLQVIAIILTILAVPTAFTLLAAYHSKWKIEGKKGLVNLARVVPVVLIAGFVMMLVNHSGATFTIKVIASALIGGIALPLFIWLVIYMYYKLRGQSSIK